MFASAPRERECVSWLLVALWSTVLFLTIPFAPTIQALVAARWGRAVFTRAVMLIVAACVVATILWRRRVRPVSPGSQAWLVLVAAVAIGSTASLGAAPVEALHFIEYGVLGLLLYRALVHRVRDRSIYLAAAMVGTIVGTVDEAIQWATPGRYWELRDIWLNVFAVALMQIAIAKGIRPALTASRPDATSIGRLCRLAAAVLLLLGASVLNTPERIAWYANRVPALAFLKANESLMLEYGHLYVDPEVGRFRSRLSPEALRRTDAERGAEAGRLLDRFSDDSTYDLFLRTYTPVGDPYVHEARVHLFRRDRNLSLAARSGVGAHGFRERMTVAYRENQILEKYFPNALHHSRHRWPPERLVKLERWVERDREYDSPVSRNLVTSVGERALIGGLAMALAGLAVVDRLAARRGRASSGGACRRRAAKA